MVSPQGQEPAGFLLVQETEALNSANSCIWIGKPMVFTVTMGHHGSPWVTYVFLEMAIRSTSFICEMDHLLYN